tara:strand:+ start:202 stop:2631 length:2430 start_codon:yes stop_codon:yes gene_type:complete
MQIKNKKLILIYFLINYLLLNLASHAEEFNITAKEIIIDKDNQIITGIGLVKAVDSVGRVINANKITYEQTKEFLLAEGDVRIYDNEGNILTSEKSTYDKNNELIVTYGSTELSIGEGYKLSTVNINYNVKNKLLSSNNPSIFKDIDGNVIETVMFQYSINEKLFSSIGKTKVTDINKNKYNFKEIHIDTKNKEMIGSDISAVLDQESFGVNPESDPRFVANDIFISKNKTDLSKGVFTICKKRDGKCPPWSIKAKKISHDKAKKTIYYEHATLKVYDIPIFYFPKFFHPDPTVKRQSGFLSPFFTSSTSLGAGFALPYYWAIDSGRDFTFSPKFYKGENPLFLNEYRQAFKNGFLTLDTSFTQGYKKNTPKKTNGSRNHIFADLDLNFNQNESYNSDLSIKIEQTSDNTYFKAHDIDTALVNKENENLENEIKYSFNNEDQYFDISTNVYENLAEKRSSDKYEYILPNIVYGRTFFSENFGILNFKSDAIHSNYNTNKYKTFLTNDVVWSPSSLISKSGIVSSLSGMLRNTNYETKKTNEYKDGSAINELSGVLSYKSSLPMKKDGINYSKLFSPNLMLRLAPGHVRNLSNKDVFLDYTNLYSLNRTNEIEDGLSAVLGFDFKTNKKEAGGKETEKISLSLGQVYNFEENDDLPSKSSLDQKTSDIVGEINYNFSSIGQIDYKFSLDHNINDLNYNEISTKLNFGNVGFNLDYLEQRNHIGTENYGSAEINLSLNDNNKLSFGTKKNFKTDSTEFYDISYQYEIDCLTAGLVYRREFYQDTDDLEPKNTMMFTITFVPFTNFNAPINK